MFNVGNLMKQAQAMQEKMAKIQAELEAIEVEGTAGGGLVKVVMTAKGAPKSVTIDEQAIDPSDKEMLEDLVTAAMSDAYKNAKKIEEEKMGAATGGLNLPAGMKLPF